MSGLVVAMGLGQVTGAARIPGQDAIVFVEGKGTISVWDSTTRSVITLGSGWLTPLGIIVAADGKTAFVTEQGGEVLSVNLGAADRANATVLVSGLDEPHQLALSEDNTDLFVVDFGPTGRLLHIDPNTGTVSSVIAGLERASGLALSPDGTSAYITEQAAGGGRLSQVDLANGTTQVLLEGLIAPSFLAWADGLPDWHGATLSTGTHLLLIEQDPANRVSVVNLATGWLIRRNIATVGYRPSSVQPIGDHLYVFTDREITELDVSAGIEPSVRLSMPVAPLFIGGWARIGVQFGGPGLSFEDIDFIVEGSPLTGGISFSKDDTFDASNPEVMLLAGSEPGTFGLVAIERSTGALLAKEPFQVSTEWPDELNGPPTQYVGESSLFVTGAAWGGGSIGPQNIDVFPANGTRRVAIVLVDTTSSRYPAPGANMNAIINKWETELLGVTDPDGVVRGVRQYYQEASYGRYDISLVGNQAFGPFQLTGSFTDYYAWDATRSFWLLRGNLFQACITAAQNQVDFDQVDTLVCVMRTVPGGDPVQFAWPAASSGTFTYHSPGSSKNTSRAFPCLTMPDDWDTRDGAGRRIHETLSHEIGHNLGLGDLYMDSVGFDPQIEARDVGGWDLMSNDNPLSQFSLPHKMMLGWVRPDWISSFDFRNSGGVDQTLTLHATELIGIGGPPAGRIAGIEVRRADGWNYYFEYRAGQVTEISDRQLPTDRRVLGTDVTSPTFTVPQSRRYVILLPNDLDRDGPVLGANADYKEADPSGPANFELDVISTAADSAQVRIRYGAGGRPDPSIRPWPGGNNWQSPDIEISNARSATRAEWRNTPWAGQRNTITAKITNGGDFVATNVLVNFYVKEFNLGNAPETWIGRDVKTIGPGVTTNFTTTWTPPANTPQNGAHYCISVRIALYQDPGNPSIVELTELNNWAQSNYTRFISSTASPAKRVRTSVTVSNPYSETTRVLVVAQQSTDWYRNYLDHNWLWLKPGESRRVGVMVESLLGDPAFPELEQIRTNVYERPHNLSLIGLIENPHDPHLHVPEVMGGANIRALTGRATRIELDRFDNMVARGRVVTVDDNQPVTYGDVIISLKPQGNADKAEYRTDQSRIQQNGTFTIELRAANLLEENRQVDGQAHFLGAFGLSDSDSKVVRLRV